MRNELCPCKDRAFSAEADFGAENGVRPHFSPLQCGGPLLVCRNADSRAKRGFLPSPAGSGTEDEGKPDRTALLRLTHRGARLTRKMESDPIFPIFR
jgi:hypothetical protein